MTQRQVDYIVFLDNKAKKALRDGGEEALLMSLAYEMNEIEDIMESSSEEELNFYCGQYGGFYEYMNLLERMAVALSEGAFDNLL